MAGLDLRRIFWIGAAALLCVAALVGVGALLTGSFDDLDAKMLATVGIVFLTGSTAVSGFALVERGTLPYLGWAGVALAPLWFAILMVATWSEDGGNWTWTAVVVSIAELVLLTDILMLRDRRLAWLVMGTAAALGLTAVLTLAAIWTDDGSATAIGVPFILTALGYFLLPVLQRLAGVPRPAARAADADTPPAAETLVARMEGLDLVAVPAGSGAEGAPFVRGEDGRLTLVRGDREILLPAGTVLALRRTRDA